MQKTKRDTNINKVKVSLDIYVKKKSLRILNSKLTTNLKNKLLSLDQKHLPLDHLGAPIRINWLLKALKKSLLKKDSLNTNKEVVGVSIIATAGALLVEIISKNNFLSLEMTVQ